MGRNFDGGGDDDDGPMCPSLKLVNQNFLNSAKILEVQSSGKISELGSTVTSVMT